MSLIKFAVSSAEFIESVNSQLFRKMRIRAFASGENAHTLPVDESVIERCACTVYDKPIVWKYSEIYNDAMGHETDEVPVGFIKESDDNPVVFEREGNRIFMTINALIWTKYCGKLIEVFENNGNHKDVSIEISALVEDENADIPLVNDFCVAGITILGNRVKPAVKGCQAELLAFSEDKNKYLSEIEFENSIRIDNSKESSVSGKWENPRRKLFNPIVKASNAKALLKEAYLVGDFSSNEPEITKFKYPHHVIRDGKLVIHKDGLNAAFQRASQQGIVEGAVKAHLLRHYRELGLSTENFSEFGFSDDDFNLYFSNINDLESGCDTNMEKENIEGVVQPTDDSQASTTEVEMSETGEITTGTVDTKSEIEMSEGNTDDAYSTVDIKNEDDNDENDNDEDDSDDNDKNDKKDDTKDEEMSLEAAMCKITEMSETITKLEADCNAYMAKIESMSDYDVLKQFKCDMEEKIAQEQMMCEMEQVMSEIANKGYTFSEGDKKNLMQDFSKFDSFDAWKNYVKAQVFDKSDSDKIVRMGLPNVEPISTGSIWDRI